VKRGFCASLMIALVQSAAAALAGDAAAGKRLHDANCTGCHDASVYTRKDHAVRSLDALKDQLDGCMHMGTKEFSSADKQNLIKYLNDRFYRFP